MSGTPRVTLMSRTAALTNGSDQENRSPMRVGGKYFSPLPMAAGHGVEETSKSEVSKPRQTRDASPSIEKTPAQPAAKTATGSAGNYRSGNCSALDAQQELHLQTWEGRLEKWKAALDKKAAQIEDSKAAAVAISKANEAEQARMTADAAKLELDRQEWRKKRQKEADFLQDQRHALQWKLGKLENDLAAFAAKDRDLQTRMRDLETRAKIDDARTASLDDREAQVQAQLAMISEREHALHTEQQRQAVQRCELERWSEKVTYWQAESLRTEEIKAVCARQEVALKARESALAIEAHALKAREVACVQREEETQRGASELLAIAAHTDGERAALRAERDELEAARLRQVAAGEAQQRHLQEQADELRAVLELHGEKSARMQQWQADLRVRDSRLREAELDLERRTESVKRVLDPFSA